MEIDVTHCFLMVTINALFFFAGAKIGRQQVLNSAFQSLASDPSISARELSEFRDQKLNIEESHRILHWGTELWPKCRYYGIDINGFQLGYWSKHRGKMHQKNMRS